MAQVICTGVEKTPIMPAAADANNADVVIVRKEKVRSVAKRRAKHIASIKR